MTIRLSIDQLTERIDEFGKRCGESKGTYRTLYLAEHRYSSWCREIRKKRMSLRSPKILNAERIYGEALSLEAEGGDIKRVASKILYAGRCLLSHLVDQYHKLR